MPQRRALLVELTYGTVGVGVVAWALSHFPADWFLTTILLVIAVAAATPFSVRLTDPVRVPGAMPIELMVMLVAPAPVSILIAACTNLFTSIRYRHPATRTYSRTD